MNAIHKFIVQNIVSNPGKSLAVATALAGTPYLTTKAIQDDEYDDSYQSGMSSSTLAALLPYIVGAASGGSTAAAFRGSKLGIIPFAAGAIPAMMAATPLATPIAGYLQHKQNRAAKQRKLDRPISWLY